MTSPQKLTPQHYSIVIDNDNERPFDAIDDSQATGLCQKRYPGQKWRLYRETAGERVEVCHSGPECSPKKAANGSD